MAPCSLGAIVGNFTSVTARRIHRSRHASAAPVWQQNDDDPIIRHEDDLRHSREYIRLNPLKWELDRENPNRTGHNPEEDWLYGDSKASTPERGSGAFGGHDGR